MTPPRSSPRLWFPPFPSSDARYGIQHRAQSQAPPPRLRRNETPSGRNNRRHFRAGTTRPAQGSAPMTKSTSAAPEIDRIAATGITARPRVLIIDDNEAIHADFRKTLAPAVATATATDLDADEASLFDHRS